MNYSKDQAEMIEDKSEITRDDTAIAFVGSSGNHLAGNVHGEGVQTCLFLHGGGQTRHSWQNTARLLSQGQSGTGTRSILVDQRGHGQSDWVEDGGYAFADFAADILTLADTIRDRYQTGTIAIGASLGGLASLMAELSRPGTLEALVLVDVVPWMEPSGIEKIQGFMGRKSLEGFATLEEAADAIAAYLPHRPRPKSLDGLRKNLRLGYDGRYRWHWDPRFLSGPRPINTGRETMASEVSEKLPGLECPVLLVRGARSELITQEAAERFLREVPHAEYADVTDAGHMVAGDNNDIFSKVVLEFVGKLKSP